MADRTLSLCMIVKDEQKTLARCLDSVKQLVDEMVIVDTGSTDETTRIAESYGAKVHDFDFSTTDFAAARNFGLQRAIGEWILVLDADEVLDVRSKPLVRPCLGFGGAGHFFQRRNYNEQSHRFTTDFVVRLFPNRPDYRYRGRVHETIDASILKAGGRLQRTGICLSHFFSENEAQRQRKSRWYIELLNKELADNPYDDGPLDFLAAEYHQSGRIDLAAEIAQRIAQARPGEARAHLTVGIYHLLLDPAGTEGRQSARKAFEKALTLKPGYLEALTFLRTIEAQKDAFTDLTPLS